MHLWRNVGHCLSDKQCYETQTLFDVAAPTDDTLAKNGITTGTLFLLTLSVSILKWGPDKSITPRYLNFNTVTPRKFQNCQYMCQMYLFTIKTHIHKPFYGPFLELRRWAGARRNFLNFMVQGKITEADTLTIRMGTTPSVLISDPPPWSPHFCAGCPSCRNPPN